jgi:hypothetical protein
MRSKATFLIFVTLLVLSIMGYFYLQKAQNHKSRVSSVTAGQDLFKEWDFSHPGSLMEWDEKIFHGRSQYNIESLPNGEMALRAQSRGTSSALYHRVDVRIQSKPRLIWEWSSPTFPEGVKEELAERKTNDFAGRVYAVFKGGTVLNSYVIQYLWDADFDEGTFATSSFAKNVKMMVVQHGPEPSQGWVLEERDLYDDYQKLFGKTPTRDLAAIAFMSDSDNTQTESGIFLRRIMVKYGKDKEKKDKRQGGLMGLLQLLAFWRGD